MARRLGVAPPTLRTWDRRYGLGPSAHTAGAHRRYSPADVARLMVMRRLTLEGVAPSDAAKIALATALTAEGRPVQSADEHTPAEGYDATDLLPDTTSSGSPAAPTPVDPREQRYPPGSFLDEVDVERAEGRSPSARPGGAVPDDLALEGLTDLGGLGAPVERPDRGVGRRPASLSGEVGPDDYDYDGPDDDDWPRVLRSVETARGGPSGGGRIVALPDGTSQSRGLARAAMALDSYETHRILRESIRRQGVVPTWNLMIMPVLRALGERVRVSGEGIDVEHAFSEVILGVMRSVAVGVRITRSSPMVLLACADSDYHSLPLHALAAALAEHEVPARMLGSGLPPHALASSVRRTGPSVIVLFARMAGADAGDAQVLRRQRPAPTVVLAGPGWRPDTIPASARTAGSLIEAIDEVLRGLHT